jgi:hypothetical protein
MNARLLPEQVAILFADRSKHILVPRKTLMGKRDADGMVCCCGMGIFALASTGVVPGDDLALIDAAYDYCNAAFGNDYVFGYIHGWDWPDDAEKDHWSERSKEGFRDGKGGFLLLRQP